MNILNIKRFVVEHFLGGEYGNRYAVYQKIFHHKRALLYYEKRRIRLREKEKFLIIRQPHSNMGLMANVNYVLVQIDIAREYNRIPIVDMKNYKSSYHSKEEVGKVNVWELFFEPISSCSLEDIYESRDYLLSGYYHLKVKDRLKSIDATQTGDLQNILYWNSIYKEYIHPRLEISNLLEEWYRELFMPVLKKNKKILGVKFRGTDYRFDLPNNHNIQPTTELMIQRTKQCLDKFGCEYIFLAVEDLEARLAFEREFGQKLITTGCKLGEYGNKKNRLGITEIAVRDVGAVQSGVDYMIEIMLLARCNSLLASGNNGTFTAIIANGGQYEFIENVNLGKKSV